MNMKQKHLAVALSAIFAAVALTGCGSDNDSNYVAPPVVTPPVVTPPVGGDEDNTGAAAEGNLNLNEQTTVGGQQYVRQDGSDFDRVLNPSNDTNANATVLNGITLQNTKLENIVIGRETVQRVDGPQAIIRFAGEAIDGISNVTSADTLQLQETNTTNGNQVGTSNFETNGLVYVSRDGQETNFTAQGEESASTLSTRIFGNKYRDDANTAAVNSYRYTGTAGENGVISTVEDFDTASFSPIKLDNVQYGRITSNIDALGADDLQEGINYYESDIVAKSTPGSVDTYFYRGTGETTIAQMNAMQATGGTVAYAGHALMYGIDNSYHGNLGDPNSNSFGGGDTAIQGGGNLVQANVNMADRTIAGNIFNVWEVRQAGTDGSENVVVQDNLVNFSGNVFGNTAKGTSQLAYGNDQTAGTFKGTFYGPQANELGGSVNSVTTGYGDPAWGGVFGAEKIQETVIITPPQDGNANQTE